MQKQPYIIVGFGIAGTTIAWQLFFKQIPFVIVASAINTCSEAAAGMINPIVFKKMNMSWMASDLLPAADQLFQNIENELGETIRDFHPIVKIFNSVEEENNWMIKKNSSSYKEYFGEVKNISIPDVDIPYGTGSVNTIGHLNASKYMKLSKLFFKKNGIEFIETNFNYNKIQGNIYENLTFEKVIFCEGYGIKKNPFFNYLPLNGTHGDTLIIRTKTYNFEGSLSRGMYVKPLGNQLYKLGASYNWEKKEPEITEAGKNNLIQRLKAFANFDYEIITQQAGIRPTVIDRRPLVGTHHQNSRLAIFNGLGTKGVMLAPYFASQLVEHLNNNAPLNDEVNITRFEKYLT
ncbi:MAG: NAD(P)/FAD-dependent oxidoreductase [Crocinitomicaceae bacterium]